MAIFKNHWVQNIIAVVVLGLLVTVLGARLKQSMDKEATLLVALEEQARRSELIVESESTAIIMCSEDGTITVSNMAAEQMFGWPHNELIGQKSSILIPEQFQEKHNAGMMEAARSIRDYPGNWKLTKRGIEMEGVKRDGDLIPILSEIRVIKYGNKVEFIVSMKRANVKVAPSPVEAQPLPEALELPTLPPELRRSAK